MIRVEKGVTEIKGGFPELLADFSCMTNGIFKVLSKDSDEEKIKIMLRDAFDDAFKTDEELLDEIIEKLANLKSIVK